VAADRKKQAVRPTGKRQIPAPTPEIEIPERPHLIGYARVSTVDQDPRMQIDALIKAGVEPDDIYQEKASGATGKRPQFQAMMKDVREGDVVIVWKLDRLGRTNIGLHQTAEQIRQKGAHLRVITQPGLDTTTAIGRAMFAMLAMFAEFEREVSLERSAAGLKAARERGRIGGATQKHSDKAILEAAKLGTKPGARHLGMSVSGFIKALARVRAKELQRG
jgi:serine recombinase